MASFNGKHVAKVWTNSPEQTYLLGKKAAEFVYGGLCIMLSGDLGSGKTVFVKGLVHGLGRMKLEAHRLIWLTNMMEE